MFVSINQALAASKARREDNEKGFTLIELLVVVLIIGILSAIAVPIFLGQQDQAKHASAKADLTNAKVALVSYATANNGTYTTDATLLGNYGYKASGNTASLTIVSASASGFCIEAVSTGNTPNQFYINQNGGVKDGTCASAS